MNHLPVVDAYLDKVLAHQRHPMISFFFCPREIILERKFGGL